VTLTGGSVAAGHLTLGTVAYAANGSIIAAGTSTVIAGASTNTVTLTEATLAGGAVGSTVTASATGLTLANGATLTLADGGTIVAAESGKLATVHAEFGAGTYTATGEVAIAAVTAGDTITTANASGDGLSLGAASSALSLLNNGANAAVYTVKVTSTDPVVFGNGTSAVAVPGTGSVEADGKAFIRLGTSGNATDAIGLVQSATLKLAVGAKLGVFSGGTGDTSVTPDVGGSVGTAVVSSDGIATLNNTTGTLTVTTADVVLTGAAGNASSITTAAVLAVNI
jgi:hypothetical protein